MLDSTELIRELVALPGPPGQEGPVRDAVQAHVRALGYESVVDVKGNLLAWLPGCNATSSTPRPRVAVTAHLDEIALMVQRVEPDGRVRVLPLGGLMPWKWGEQPVDILSRGGPLPGVVSFGCIHTNAPDAVTFKARTAALTWDQAFVFTGQSAEALAAAGVRPGVRVALARERRTVREMGDSGEYLVSYFLDDRADLAAWLLALEELNGEEFPAGVVFVASVSEEVGGEGAAYVLQQLQSDICVALEIGPSVPESPFTPDREPTIWVTDSYSTITAEEMERAADICRALGQEPHWQPLSRGGSDASSAASRGLTAHPMTFGLPVENSHGLEIMHRAAPAELARLTAAYVRAVTADV